MHNWHCAPTKQWRWLFFCYIISFGLALARDYRRCHSIARAWSGHWHRVSSAAIVAANSYVFPVFVSVAIVVTSANLFALWSSFLFLFCVVVVISGAVLAAMVVFFFLFHISLFYILLWLLLHGKCSPIVCCCATHNVCAVHALLSCYIAPFISFVFHAHALWPKGSLSLSFYSFRISQTGKKECAPARHSIPKSLSSPPCVLCFVHFVCMHFKCFHTLCNMKSRMLPIPTEYVLYFLLVIFSAQTSSLFRRIFRLFSFVFTLII